METRGSRLVALLWVAAALVAAGGGEAAADVDGVSAVSGDGHRRFGVMADAGVPDGATASLVVRPIRAIRAHAGVGSNAISTGLRAGVTVVPLSGWFSPSLSVDVGRYPEGDANPLVRRVMGDPTYSSTMLEQVGYDYLNAHVGFELGRKWV